MTHANVSHAHMAHTYCVFVYTNSGVYEIMGVLRSYFNRVTVKD